MSKTLLNKIGNAVKRSALIGLASLSFAACQPNINPIPETNYAPTVTISSPNIAIKVGESAQLKFTWEDKNGNDDIAKYELGLDKNSNNQIDTGEELLMQSTPFTDYTFTPTSAGNFKFIAEDIDKEGLTGKANLEITVSNSDLPTLDLSSINTDLVDGKTKTITLPSPTDDDTSGIIPYINAKVLSGNAIASLNGNQLTLNANSVSQDSPYQLELTFGTTEGGINTATLNGKIKNLLDITGNIQDNETQITQAGKVKIYNYDDVATYDSLNNFTGYNFTSKTPLIDQDVSSGNFSQIQLSKVVSKAVLRAKLNPDSYIRTITLDGTKDYTSQNNNSLTDKIRVVPYPTLYSKEDFKEFMMSINYTYGGISKWNLDNLVGIEILKYNPLTGDSFTTLQQQAIISKLSASYDIPLFINSKKNLGSIIRQDTKDNQDSNKHYDLSGNPEIGWIIVVPNNSILYAGQSKLWNLEDNAITGVMNKAKVEIKPEHAVDNDPVLTHEFGHVFIAPNGEATLSPNLTIMNINWVIFTPGVADIKAGKIIYEDTYLPREKLDDILGLSW